MQNNVFKEANKTKIAGQWLNNRINYFLLVYCVKCSKLYRKAIDVKLMEHSFFWVKCLYYIR